MQTMTAGAFPDWFPTDSPGDQRRSATVARFADHLSGRVDLRLLRRHARHGLGQCLSDHGLHGAGRRDVLCDCRPNWVARKLAGELADVSAEAFRKTAVRAPRCRRRSSSPILLIPLSVGMFPHLFQHWLTAKSASSFKLPVVAHPIFIMIVWVPCVLIGIWATTGLVPPTTAAEQPERDPAVPGEDASRTGAGRLPHGRHPGGDHVVAG